MFRRSVLIGILVSLLSTFAASAQQTRPATQPTPDVALERLVILEPTQGRARIIKPFESFYFMFRVDRLDVPKVEVSLANSLCQQEKIRLVADAPPVAMQVNHWVMLLKAPERTPPGVYDLVIDLGVGFQRVPRAIKVVDQFKTRFRFVHLSDMNVGGPTTPDFDPRLVEEINLLNPEFIIATGDFLESARRGPDAWPAAKRFLGRFHAPTYILCGDKDDVETYPQHIAPSFIGTFDYGQCHFFFMMDTSAHPVEQDPLQLKALLSDLGTARPAVLTFLVGHRDRLGVLDGLRTLGKDPAQVFTDGKVRYLVCGGSVDWDYKEYAAKLAAAKLDNVTYIRTGQSSTCMTNGGPGYSKYRVFDVDGSDVKYLYPGGMNDALQCSVPAGRIRTFTHGPNDGTRTTERITVLNTLDQSFSDCRVAFRLAGADPNAVKIANGRIERILPAGNHRLLVLVTIDLPERAAVQVLATTDPEVDGQYRKIPVQFDLTVPAAATFRPARTAAGLKFFAAPEELTLSMTNSSDQPIQVKPQVTLAGQELLIAAPTSQSGNQTPVPGAEGYAIPPGKTIKVPVKLAILSITPGRRLVQVYCTNDPLQRVTVFPLQVTVADESETR